MKKKIYLLALLPFLVACSISESTEKSSKSNKIPSCTSDSDDISSDIPSEYDEEGRLKLNLRNLYFDMWCGEDPYTKLINDKFGVSIRSSGFSYGSWNEEVQNSINGNSMADAFNFNLTGHNSPNTYKKWVKEGKLKALPDNLDSWPNIKKLINSATNIEYLKVDNKLYGIPVMNDISQPENYFHNFTYVYRRDWAKQIDEMNAGKSGYIPVYKENDVYTWDEFLRLCDAFNTNIKTLSGMSQASVLVDEQWGFPSVTNFYKDAPHCYAKDDSGKAIANFAGEKYLAGLEVAKDLVSNKKIYSQDQFNFADNKANQLYLGGQAAILYDNYSLANYIKLRKLFKASQKSVNLDDGTAFLKIKGPDGKFALEGTENWFSMTMFNADISDKKLEKILDILDYLLTEEGTRLAIYGKEGYDYSIVDGQVVLSEMGWEKDQMTGQYANKTNGAKYLRYMVTLGNDTKAFDPFTEQDAFNLLNAWQEEMKAAKNAGNLRVVKEPADIAWMSTPSKNDKTEGLLNDANTAVLKYCFDKITLDAYKSSFEDNNWKKVLQEINEKLGK